MQFTRIPIIYNKLCVLALISAFSACNKVDKMQQVCVGINHDLDFDQRVARKMVWINGEPVGVLASHWPSMVTCYGFPIAFGSNSIQIKPVDSGSQPNEAEWLSIKAAVYSDGQEPASKKLFLRHIEERLDGTFVAKGGRIDKIAPGVCSAEIANHLKGWIVNLLDLMEQKDYNQIESLTGRKLDRQSLPPWAKFPLVERVRSVDEMQFTLGKSMVIIYPKSLTHEDAEEVLWKSESREGFGCKISSMSFIIDDRGRCFLAPGLEVDVISLGKAIEISAYAH